MARGLLLSIPIAFMWLLVLSLTALSLTDACAVSHLRLILRGPFHYRFRAEPHDCSRNFWDENEVQDVTGQNSMCGWDHQSGK